MKRFVFLVILGAPSALPAQAKVPSVAVQVGAADAHSLNGVDGGWASLGLAWNLSPHLDLVGRAEYVNGALPPQVCNYSSSCPTRGDTREHSSAVVGELAWWSGRGNGLHAVLSPGLALQHMRSAYAPYQRSDWLSQQISAGAAWTLGHHVLSGGARVRSPNHWDHSMTRFALTWWVGWQWRKAS